MACQFEQCLSKPLNLDELPAEILDRIGGYGDSQADIDSLYAVNRVLRAKCYDVKHESVALAIPPPTNEDPYEVALRSLYVDRYGPYRIPKHQIPTKTPPSVIYRFLRKLCNIVLFDNRVPSAIKPSITKHLVILPAFVATAAREPSLSPQDYRGAMHGILHNQDDLLSYTELQSFKWSCGRDLELELLAKLCNAAPNIKRLEINSLVVNGKLMSKETEEPIATNIASNLNGLQHLALVFGQSPWIDNSITRLIDRVLLPVLRRDSKLSYSAVFGSRHGMAMQPRLESVNSPFPMNTPIFSPVSTVTGLHLSGLSFDSVSISSRLSLPCLTHLEIDRCSGTTQLLNTLSHPQKPLPLTALIIRNVQKPPRQHGSRPYSPRNLDQALDAILQLCTKLKTLVIDRADNDRLRDLRL